MSIPLQLQNKLGKNRLYQNVHNLIKEYEPHIMVENFKNLGEYIRYRIENKEKIVNKYLEELHLEIKKSDFYKSMEKFNKDDLIMINRSGLTPYFYNLGYNLIFREYFYDWFKLVKLGTD